MTERQLNAFVVGHPIAHSRSPLIHGFWLQELGLAGSYRALDVAPREFADFLKRIDGRFVGGNITIPHKESAYAAVGRCDAAAEEIGAVNTVWLEEGIVVGTNTDAYGFAANLDDCAPGWDRRGPALVLGAGGAARAVIFALRQRGMTDIRLVNRTVERARDLSDRFGDGVSAHSWAALPELAADAGLLVNTTSLGMAGGESAAVEMERLPHDAIVTDIVYVPRVTPLLAAARRRGLATVDGLGMLLHQAVPGFERWFGRRPTVSAALRERVVADLDDEP
jgi:shikimate dehydrogenase